ncbi:Glucosamine-6-phosphate deaminase [Lunatimonas lonarensis]|uniref:Glucosamine-6-phosphate deaminase n=1 Tax=Lunatimonas lonarensis TaxID=1232681 RepID=R7ZRT3_9BACT|nr:glucosamine-6-phosphate deaminase [Lunatimonas lonarensis]EON76792.1 Glucosamine-6-phosphate deaminase [Lunatimonas lonarensis]
MDVRIFDSIEELDKEVARLIIGAVKENPSVVLGLSTGNSPVGVYKNLIADHQQNGTPYGQVTTFNLDEYAGLDGESPQSYRYFMNEQLFDHLDIDKAKTHVPSGIGDLEENCREYEQKIQAAGGISIQLIGIGTNGHIAFNEPGTPFDSLTHVAELSQATIDSNAKYFPSPDDIPLRAVSMGIQSIMNAHTVYMVAFGKSKAKAIKEMIEGPVTTALPASVLQRHPSVYVFLDREAASLLSS